MLACMIRVVFAEKALRSSRKILLEGMDSYTLLVRRRTASGVSLDLVLQENLLCSVQSTMVSKVP